MRKILITGASGFLGRHCLNSIDYNKYEVHAISHYKLIETNNKSIVWHKVNLHDHDSLTMLMGVIKPKYLLHLAWYMEPGLKLDNEVHYKWFETGAKLIDAFIRFGGRKVVVSGSCAEYDWGFKVCNEETTPLCSSNAYGKSKNLLRDYIDSLCEKDKLSYSWGRIFFTYGPGEKPQRLVPYVINSILGSKIAHCSPGQQIFDYLYIEDVARALVLLLDFDINGAINISSGKPLQVKELVLKIGAILKGQQYIEFSPNKTETDPMYLIGDNSRLINEVNWRPKFNIEQGLKQTIQHCIKEKLSVYA